MESIIRDLRYGLRMLVKNFGFTSIAVLTLALGIGANSAIFSVVNAVLLQPLPVHEPDRLVTVGEDNLKKEFNDMPLSPAKFVDLRDQSTVFDSIVGIYSEERNLTGTDEPESLTTTMVMGPFFDAVGTAPALGRSFATEEDRFGGPQVVILSDELWRRRFGSDLGVIGQSMELSKIPHTIVGVMPVAIESLYRPDVWVPAAFHPNVLAARPPRFLRVVARLSPDVTLPQAQAEMDALSARLEEEYPETEAGWSLQLRALHEQTTGPVRTGLLVLLGAVGLVLLIACVNVANLSMTRADARRGEIAVRMALGASRWQVARQFLAESAVLAVLGGGLGLLLGVWSVDWLVALSAGDLPRAREIGLDTSVVMITLAISIMTGLVFGLAPAWRATRASFAESFKEGSTRLGGSVRRERLRSVLVVGEVALAFILLMGAALLIQSFVKLQKVSPGFETDNRLVVKLSLPWARYAESVPFYQNVLERVSTLPGVQSVGAISFLPMDSASTPLPFTIQGRPEGDDSNLFAALRAVNSSYFSAMGIPLQQGRVFDVQDTPESPVVVLVNDVFSRRFFSDENPVGKRLHQNLRGGDGADPGVEIVGVVGSVHHRGLDRAPEPEIYYHYPQSPWPSMSLVLRTSMPVSSVVRSVRSEVMSIDPTQPVFGVTTMADLVDESVSRRRLNMLLLGLFAMLAVILASVGIYGLIAFSVNERTHEFGIRMALGAVRQDVLKLVVRQGMLLTVVGVGIGIVGALALTRLLESLLFEVSATNPIAFVLTSILLAGVALLACYVPSRRATRVDPMVILRFE